MNIQNISALAEQLELLGFENVDSLLLKRICFKPDSFTLSYKIDKGKDRLNFQVYFEKDRKSNCYVLMFHDAVLQKGVVLPDTIIHGIDIHALEKQMAEIDWAKVFQSNEKKQWDINDKLSLELAEKIEAIIESLAVLESAEGAKEIALSMKLKFWNGLSFPELNSNPNTLKSKSEVSQRFYFFEGQVGIGIEEAYRYLQNKWIEKEMQLKRKQIEDSRESNGASQSTASSGVLKKKKIHKGKS